jgi:hypothetical protein
MEMREPMLRVIDHEAYRGNRTSKMITRKEHAMLYKDTDPLRLSFIFEVDKEKLIPEKQAKFLKRKFGAVIEILGQENIKLNGDEKAQYQLETMGRPDLIKLAARFKIANSFKMSKENLIEAIKAKIIAGEAPMSEQEYENRDKKS